MPVNEILARCDNVLPGHGPAVSLKERLTAMAAAMDGSEDADVYGAGDTLDAFEAELAERFGKDAAVFMPSGTMAQQIALRIHCERSGRDTIAMHPSAHLEFAEHLGYRFLHGLQRLQFGAPEAVGARTLTADDFAALGATPGVALLELPYRPLGGVLPPWNDVVAISEWCRERGVPLHLDGARIWQCAGLPHKGFDHDHAQIAAQFDSLYVSFYKDVGALCGAALIGSEDFVAEARVWQRRHGGNLYTQAPFVISARQRLAETLPQMPAWNARAREIAAALAVHPRVRIQPDPPDVNFFQVHLDVAGLDLAEGGAGVGAAERLKARHDDLAEQTGCWLFGAFQASATPGFLRTEVHCWENALRFDTDRLGDFLEQLLG